MHWGLNVDPLNPAGRPDPAYLRSLGFASVRMVARDHPDLYAYHDACTAAGLATLVVIARESVEGEWARTVAHYGRRLNPWGWQLGNEPDATGPSSWIMSPAHYVTFWHEAEQQLAWRGAMLVSAGLASGQPDYLAEIVDGLPGCNAVAVHPYDKTADEAATLLAQYRALTVAPLLVTEWSRPAVEIGPFLRMLHQETAASWWFAATNGMVPGFGLLDDPAKLAAMKEGIMSLVDGATEVEQRLARLESRMDSEERRNAWLVEWLAHYGLDDPDIKQLARTIADACSPGILDGVAIPPPPGQ